MTQFDKTYISPPGPPNGPKGLIESDHLHYLIARLKHSQVVCLAGMDGLELRQRMTRGRLMSRWMQAARDLARLGREVFKLEKHNHFIKTKWEMLRDPDWRARVMRELGGERALRLWERRFARTGVRRPAADVYGPPQILPALSTPLREDEQTRVVKTDSQGQFRLAQISRGSRPWRLKIFQRRIRNSTWGLSWEIRERKFPPIPVTPGELRGDTINDVIPDKADRPQIGDLVQTKRKVPYHAFGTEMTSKPLGHALTRSRICAALVRDDNEGEGNNEKPP